jgi:ribonuclease HII
VGISSEIVKDKKMINRLEDIKKLPEKEREKIFDYIDLVIRDVKIKKGPRGLKSKSPEVFAPGFV